MQYQCVDCGGSMSLNNNQYTCLACHRTYTADSGVFDARSSQLSELAKEEALYHDHIDEDACETHQLSAWRNVFYHQYVWNFLTKVPKQATLVEVGAGTGFDAEQIYDQDKTLVLTDISAETLKRVAQRLNKNNIQYVAADGVQLPLADESCDVVYMIAVWHHFEKPGEALEEWRRILKKDGQLVIGVEPNRFYFYPIKKLRPFLCHAIHADEHEGSHADAEMEGFSYGQIQKYLGSGWRNVTIRPMWLFGGWMHYGLEFIYRVFHLKKRIQPPLWVEKMIVGFDELLFRIPGVRHLCWHWIVTAQKV